MRFYRTFTNHLITAFPKPTGPFAIGTFSRVIADPARTNYYRYQNQTNSFMLTCWYPAEPQAGLLPGAAWDSRVYQDVGLSPQLNGHSLPNAPIAHGTDRYPVILFSHGYALQRKANCHEAEELASHGYVVVGVDHEDCWGTVFPDGRYLKTYYPSPIAPASVPYLIDSRVKDLTFVMGELGRLDTNDPWLAGRLDLNCLGTLGMSFGGSSTANLCRTNAAVKCAAFLDAAFHFEVNVQLNQEGLQKPFLAMNNNNSSEPQYVFWPESTHLFNLATTNATIFQIANTRHFSFFDFAWFYPGQYRQSRVMDACLVSFFNKHLKAQDDHLLDQTPPQYPDENFQVINFMNK
jgi:predicted dienelactone hydrolase